jgi:hypothetical protein
MGGIFPYEPVAGFDAPVHRALTDPILLGGHRARSQLPMARWPRPSDLACGFGFQVSSFGRSAMRRPSGRRNATRNSSTLCAAICATPHISGCETMLNLAEYRKKPQRLADFLPWAALIAPGIVLNKDGSFQRTARFRGPDLDSATPAELVGTTARLNNALRRLGSGWAIFVEASLVPGGAPPVRVDFVRVD